jgi:segregation and condensation protein A
MLPRATGAWRESLLNVAVQLESEVDFQLQLDNFEGPFDLLLNLIGRHEMEITQVALAKVTNEFLKYVKGLDAKKEIDSASEFLVVAATLLDMKLASLLPQGEVVDSEDVSLLEARDLLFARLLQYRAFKEVASWFHSALDAESERYPRAVRLEEPYRNLRPELEWTTTTEELNDIAKAVFAPNQVPEVGISHLHAPKVSIREQVGIMVKRLKQVGKMTFRQLIGDVSDRAEFVARFLGILELYRIGAVGLKQEESFSEIDIQWQSKDVDQDQLAKLGADYDN